MTPKMATPKHSAPAVSRREKDEVHQRHLDLKVDLAEAQLQLNRYAQWVGVRVGAIKDMARAQRVVDGIKRKLEILEKLYVGKS